MPDQPKSPDKRQLFLSYARADAEIAHRVADSLRRAGLQVLKDDWALDAADSIKTKIEEMVRASDLLLVLLSPQSVSSHWVQFELNTALSTELNKRAITIVPAIIENCEIPRQLANRTMLDLRQDLPGALRRLTDQLATASKIDFSRLDRSQFEKLVSDLLNTVGFSVRQLGVDGAETDFIATYPSSDPFGSDTSETWIVEAKFYREERVSVSALNQMLEYLDNSSIATKGLIITNGGVTSTAREFLSSTPRKQGKELRVIDGDELTNLLIAHPEITKRYFSQEQGT